MVNKTPYLNILQSAVVIPPPTSESTPLALDVKILPDANIPPESFYGIWLLDISGSMAGDRLENAKQSLIEQINILPNDTIFSLYTFETDIHEIASNVTINDTSRKSIVDKISKIEDHGTTSLHSALKRAVELLSSYVRSGKPHNIRKIILISDGDPTDIEVDTGNESDPNYEKYWILAKESLEYGASIDTVGALGEHNVYLMYEIAKRSTGKYIFAENAEELKTKMIIATEQTVRIAYSQPTLTIKSLKGNIKLDDAAQYKPTVIRMPFETITPDKAKTFLRSFEAGDTYQILIKGQLQLDPSKITKEKPEDVLQLDFDFDEGIKLSQIIKLTISDDPTKYKLNQDINRRYANVFSQAEEIADCTIRGDAQATQRIQGDETKKIN